jgi:RNA polymerase sigma-70 factor (ECF subfamily)
MIELRFFEELSYDEIAQELNIPLGTVKAQLFRAKEILYTLLQTPSSQAYLETTARKPKSTVERELAKQAS